MKSIHEFSEIFLHRDPVDGRKAINGLASIVQSELGKNPFHGGLFVFTNKKRDVVRILYWDRSGFALWVKRLEQEKFHWPRKSKDDVVILSSAELSWLLDGFDITRMKPHQSLSFRAVS
jgi:transposase